MKTFLTAMVAALSLSLTSPVAMADGGCGCCCADCSDCSTCCCK